MKEDKFINLIKTLLPASSGYIGDDTAYIPEKDLILTQDTLIEDVHFRRATISPYDLGIKAIAVNLSDIAASGGIPGYVLISLSLPENYDGEFLESFYKGIKDICDKYNTLVVGGDLTKASKITISVAAIGFGQGIIPAKRSNARIGDYVITTGDSGSSGAGLWLLETGLRSPDLIKNIPADIQEKFIKAHINPIPHLKEGRALAESCDSPPAMMDTSDGLADALYKICLQSNVNMEINYNDIPVDKDLDYVADIAQTNIFKWVFYGGEDYKLVATVSKECLKRLNLENIRVIGRVIRTDKVPSVWVKMNDKIVEINQDSIDNQVFSHFK